MGGGGEGGDRTMRRSSLPKAAWPSHDPCSSARAHACTHGPTHGFSQSGRRRVTSVRVMDFCSSARAHACTHGPTHGFSQSGRRQVTSVRVMDFCSSARAHACAHGPTHGFRHPCRTWYSWWLRPRPLHGTCFSAVMALLVGDVKPLLLVGSLPTVRAAPAF